MPVPDSYGAALFHVIESYLDSIFTMLQCPHESCFTPMSIDTQPYLLQQEQSSTVDPLVAATINELETCAKWYCLAQQLSSHYPAKSPNPPPINWNQFNTICKLPRTNLTSPQQQNVSAIWTLSGRWLHHVRKQIFRHHHQEGGSRKGQPLFGVYQILACTRNLETCNQWQQQGCDIRAPCGCAKAWNGLTMSYTVL